MPSGDESSTTTMRKPSGAASRSDRADRRDDRLEVLRLVVGGQDDPGDRGHGRARTLENAARARPAERHDRRALRRAGRPLRARRRRRAPGARLPQRGQGGARGAALGGRDDARRERVTELPGIGRTLEEKIHALLETGHDPGGREAARPSSRPGSIDMTRLPGPGAQARPPAVRRAGHRLARRAARRRPRPSGCATCAASGRSSRRRCWRRSPRASASQPRGRGCCCNRALQHRPTASSRRCARIRRPTGSSSPARARRLADSVKDLDIIATATDPPALLRALRRARRRRVVGLARRQRGARPHPQRAERRPARRRARPVRQPAAALHRLQGAQHGAARGARSAAGCTSREYGITRRRRRASRTAARPRRRSTSCSGCRGSRPSCARTAASCAALGRRGPARWSRSATCAATCTCTPSPPTGATRSRRWRARRASAAWSTSRSPTTRRRTASATTSTPDDAAPPDRARPRGQRARSTASRC